MNPRKVIAWVVIAFAAFYLIQAPEASAAMVRGAGHALGGAASSVLAFVKALV